MKKIIYIIKKRIRKHLKSRNLEANSRYIQQQ